MIEDAAPALDGWVREAHEVRFLITSRERTRLPGEVAHELGPLGLPDSDEQAAGAEAVELFLDRVRALAPRGAPGADALPKVAALVRKLEGIPLAIELAAARADILGLDALHARLSRRLDLLGGGVRGVEARQATLRSALEWSWDLLDEADRRALARASVFRGGFSLEAAEAVLGEPGSPAIDRVQSLRDKSLLRAAPRAPGGPVRFSLYEGVRELSAEKLAERGEGGVGRGAPRRLLPRRGRGGRAGLGAHRRRGGARPHRRRSLEPARGRGRRARARRRSRRRSRALLVVDPVLGTRGPFGMHLELFDRALAGAGGRRGSAPRGARARGARAGAAPPRRRPGRARGPHGRAGPGAWRSAPQTWRRGCSPTSA